MQATDCSFLYFNLGILEAVSEACTQLEEARKLPYILAAFSDAHTLLGTNSGSPAASHEVCTGSGTASAQGCQLADHCLCGRSMNSGLYRHVCSHALFRA